MAVKLTFDTGVHPDWLFVILTIGWIVFGLMKGEFEYLIIPTIFWMVVVVIGDDK